MVNPILDKDGCYICNDKINVLFPFYFIVDEQLHISEAGISLKKLFPDIVSKSFSDFFVFRQPRSIQLNIHSISEYINQIIILETHSKNRIIYRGQVVSVESYDRLLFVGSPWITDVDDLKKNNLLITDFALHDTTTDMMQIVKSKDIMMADIKKLVTDLNHQKEFLIKAKETAEHSQRVKEVFLTNMSHELRTPLNAIIGYSEILNNTILNEDQLELAQIIMSASENLLSIINNIMDFTKIESGNVVLEKIPICIQDIMNDVRKILSGKAEAKHLEFKFFLDNEIPQWVLGDSTRLTQIFVNLLGNAIKFTENGKVHFFGSVLSKEGNNYLLEFRISDTGVGIPADKINLIFERFVQAEDQITRKFGGTGLGLSITKMLVDLHGGKIDCDSTPGKGSEFVLEIPFTKTQKEDVISEEGSPTFPANLKILLVEDNPMNQNLVQRVLESFGAVVEVAKNGRVAIDMVQKKSYQLILMDLQMPEMDGYSATQFIRNDLNNDTPIIACTADVMLNEKEKCFEIGMNGYLAKPYKAKDLIKAINSVLEHSA